MTVNNMINMMAGVLVLLGLALAHFFNQVNLLTPSWLWLCAFVGLNLFQFSITKFCPAGYIFRKLGFKDSNEACCAPNESCCSK